MNITLYNIPQLSAHKSVTLNFNDLAERNTFFNSQTKLTPNYAGNDWEEYNLENEITVNYIDMVSNPYNYVEIVEKNTNQKHYYFVVGYEQLGVSSTSLKLKKDTFMTYLSIPNTGVSLSYRPSLVVREHKPRFNYANNKVIFDEFLENDNNTTPKILAETSLSGTTRFRLVYRNRTSDWKPVAYVYTETAQTVTFIADDFVASLTPAAPSEIAYCWSGNYQYTTSQYGTPTTSITDNWTLYYHILAKSAIDGHWFVARYNKSTGNVVATVFDIPTGGIFKIKIPPTNLAQIYYCPRELTWSNIQSNYQTLNNEPSGTAITQTFSAIDIYDQNNERIIELPYFDSELTFRKDGQGLYITLEQNTLYQSTISLPIKRVGTYLMSKVDQDRIAYNEPKLYTSQFAPYFVSMNGMVQPFKLEWLDKGFGVTNSTRNVRLKLSISTLMPSLFNLEMSPETGSTYVKSQIDELIKRWTVNNEVAVVKDEAYTYNEYYRDLDDRSRKIAEDASLRNTAINSINQGLNVVGGAFNPKNAAQIGTRAASSALSIANSFIEHQDYMQQNMIKYNQKFLQLQLSMSQISGSSLDFIKTYNGDKFRYHSFGLRDRDLSYWDLHFHKFGYQTLEYKIPSLRTRKYFDYKQMILDEYDQGWGITEECFQDLRVRFAEGITIFHYILQGGAGIVDWQQLKENWEV